MNFIDMHCDTILSLVYDENSNLKNNNLMIDLNKLKKSNYLLQCFAMFVRYKTNDNNYSPYNFCNKMIDKYYSEIENNTNLIVPVLKYSDIEKNKEKGLLSSLLTIEEGGVCEGEIEKLRHFYDKGVRMMTLTWNFKNEIAMPNQDYTNRRPSKEEQRIPNTIDGLTEFGIEVVKEMNNLGMVIDCSHASDKTFYDVINISTKPIVCSHSCARNICGHSRNMTDDMLIKLKENGGVVGINFCHDFVVDNSQIATIKDVVKHINYIKNLIGVDYIGLGSDFDGISNEDIEIKDATYMPLLVEELINQGYSNEEIEKITHKNVLRVLKSNLK